ncbi:hypothetical protein NDA12_004333 [Ustilago hordei]|nr:hypothetical protein NDA12_004333 [Ustilago hordei]
MGPKVMVTTADPFEEATDSGDGHTGSTEMGDPEAMDLSSYQQPMDPDHEEEHNDDDDEGNVSGILSLVSIGTHNLGVVEASVADTADYDLILGFTELRRLKPTIQWDMGQLEFKTQEQDRPPRRPPEAARAGDLTMRRPTLHGNEFVSAERILRAALEDGPIGFMLLEEPPSSLPAFGFVPTGADKGVEMESLKLSSFQRTATKMPPRVDSVALLERTMQMIRETHIDWDEDQVLERAFSLINIQPNTNQAEKIPKSVLSIISQIVKLNENNWAIWEPMFMDCIRPVKNAKRILTEEIPRGHTDYDEELDSHLLGLILSSCDHGPTSRIDTYTLNSPPSTTEYTK